MSTRRQSSDAKYLDNAARPTSVHAKPLKSRQFPAFRTDRKNLARSVHRASGCAPLRIGTLSRRKSCLTNLFAFTRSFQQPRFAYESGGHGLHFHGVPEKVSGGTTRPTPCMVVCVKRPATGRNAVVRKQYRTSCAKTSRRLTGGNVVQLTCRRSGPRAHCLRTILRNPSSHYEHPSGFFEASGMRNDRRASVRQSSFGEQAAE